MFTCASCTIAACETGVKMHPELAEIKQKLYNLGAVYAAMSGSGSAIFCIVKHKPANVEEQFEGIFCKIMKL